LKTFQKFNFFWLNWGFFKMHLRKKYKPIIAYIIFAFIFIIIGHWWLPLQKGLQFPLLELPQTTVDLWSITHVIMYAYFGWLMPGKGFEFFLFGVGFEVLEDYLASNAKTQLFSCASGALSFWCHSSSNDIYWYGKWDDLLFNLLGYTIGEFVKKKFNKLFFF